MMMWLSEAENARAQQNHIIEKYNTLNGLWNDHWVMSTQMDQKGLIWLGLNKGGLACFDGLHFTHYPIPENISKELKNEGLRWFIIDKKGKFWLAFLPKIVFFNPVDGTYSMPDTLGGGRNESGIFLSITNFGNVIFWRNDSLFMANSGGMPRYVVDIDWKGLPIDTVYAITEQAGGRLWMRCNNGFYEHMPGRPDFVNRGNQWRPEFPFPAGSSRILMPAAPPSVRFWKMDDDRLTMIDEGGRELESYRDKGFSRTYHVFETEGIRWMSTFDGLVKITRRDSLFQTWLNEPFDLGSGPTTGTSLYGLVELPNGNLLVSDGNHNVYEIFAKQPGRYRKLKIKGFQYNTGAMLDKNQKVWFSRFFSVLNPGNDHLTVFKHDGSKGMISCFMQEQGSGDIWGGTVSGLVIFNQTNQTFSYPENPDNDIINHLYQSADGHVWVATNNGLLKLEPRPGGHIKVLARYNSANTPGLLTNTILSISEHEGYFWCGSKKGLVRFDKQTGQACTFTSEKNGLPNNTVYGAVAAEGFLWLPTNNGLARVAIESAKKGNDGLLDVAIFGTNDGLPHFEFNTLSFLKAKNGRIWMGGLNGLVSFDPKALIPDRSVSKPVLITEFSKYDSQKDSLLTLRLFTEQPKEPLLLRPEERFFSIRFALLDYRNPKGNKYRYWLEGYEPGWVFIGNQNTLRFDNLPPGRYILHIQGADTNGNWSDQKAIAVIEVQQAWYKTVWARTGYVLLFLALSYWAWRARLRRIQLGFQLQVEQSRIENLKAMEAFRGQFFTNITHEFRTPLTVIMGLSEDWTHVHDLTAGGRRTLGLIHRNAKNLLRLINQILDLAKIETNSLKINYVQGEVMAYVRYVAESLYPLAKVRQVSLVVETGDVEVVMDFDPDALQQIVYNLLSNAIKFTPAGGQVLLRLFLESDADAATPCLNMIVSDTGVGIPEEDLPFIFDRFFQSNRSKARSQTGGSGIGLALTQELVKAIGGDIAVQSKVGQGTTFTLRLPVTNKGEHQSLTALAPIKASDDADFEQGMAIESAQVEAKGPLILLVEDNPDVMAFLSACLSTRYQLAKAFDGKEGIKMATALIPDMVISDIMMDVLNGLELCEMLKNDERTSHIPVILLTAKADVESKIAGLKKGADAYITKPFHQSELGATIEGLLEVRSKLQERYNRLLEMNRPDPPLETPAEDSVEDAFLQKLKAHLEEHLGNPDFNGFELAKRMNLGEVQLYRKIKALTDKSTAIYMRSFRLQKARAMLHNTSLNVSEIAYCVGFADPNYFSRTYVQEFGIAPSDDRKQV
ncbi:MAG: ATP-binding protein [Saprospiraceae bacterium]|nr:ATP-binding protein [Saprospiraceae bacterium]